MPENVLELLLVTVSRVKDVLFEKIYFLPTRILLFTWGFMLKLPSVTVEDVDIKFICCTNILPSLIVIAVVSPAISENFPVIVVESLLVSSVGPK